jgi:nitrogen fixation/metabolism regulation signal transduction histidine kinase
MCSRCTTICARTSDCPFRPSRSSCRASRPASARCFHNLLQNAIDAQADVPEPRYEITLSARDSEVALAFCDGGSGFPESVLHRAFEPYVTTKAKGTGLGLAIVKKIVDEHHGTRRARQRAPRGAQVTLIFPRSAAAA